MVIIGDSRGNVDGQTVVWPGPVYLSKPEEGEKEDSLSLRKVGTDYCHLYLFIFKSEEGYSGVVRDFPGTYRAELSLDADGKVTGYTVKKCPEGHSEEMGSTHNKAILLFPEVYGGTFNFDLSQIQIAGIERPSEETATVPTSFAISDDGVLTGIFSDGSVRSLYQLALATCPAQDKMAEKSGGVCVPTFDSGDLVVGTSGKNGFGTVVSGALEDSTTDIAQELAEVIRLQSAYAANTQVIGSISEILKMLMRM
jgi:hypothetical protein